MKIRPSCLLHLIPRKVAIACRGWEARWEQKQGGIFHRLPPATSHCRLAAVRKICSELLRLQKEEEEEEWDDDSAIVMTAVVVDATIATYTHPVDPTATMAMMTVTVTIMVIVTVMVMMMMMTMTMMMMMMREWALETSKLRGLKAEDQKSHRGVMTTRWRKVVMRG